MLLILWIFLSVRQISQCFFTYRIQLSELLVQKILSLKLETGLEGQRNVYLFWGGDSVFRSNCCWHLATINSENIHEGSPAERLYVTSLSWDSQEQGNLDVFPLYILDFGGDQKTQPSVTVLPSGYCKTLRFWDYCFLESACETQYGLFNKGGNCLVFDKTTTFHSCQESETSDDILYCDLVP